MKNYYTRKEINFYQKRTGNNLSKEDINILNQAVSSLIPDYKQIYKDINLKDILKKLKGEVLERWYLNDNTVENIRNRVFGLNYFNLKKSMN